jgi:uncharacterized protein (TIGR00730 family)
MLIWRLSIWNRTIISVYTKQRQKAKKIMKSLTVYCASSEDIDPAYRLAARAVGEVLGERGISLVFGGGRVGLMGEVARAARGKGGRVVGVITKFLMDIEQGDPDCDEMLVVETMRERKRILVDRSDGFLVLPGGVGTYEEFFETLVGRQLMEHNKPIGIINTNNFFDPLLALFEHGEKANFIRPETRDLFVVGDEPGAVIDALGRIPQNAGPQFI